MADYTNGYRFGASGGGGPASDDYGDIDAYEMRRQMDRDRLKKIAIGAGVAGAIGLGAMHLFKGRGNAAAYQQQLANAQHLAGAAQAARTTTQAGKAIDQVLQNQIRNLEKNIARTQRRISGINRIPAASRTPENTALLTRLTAQLDRQNRTKDQLKNRLWNLAGGSGGRHHRRRRRSP